MELIRTEAAELTRRYHLAEGLIELRNMALVASLIIHSALKRRESRGLHFTTDFPFQLESHPRNTRLKPPRREKATG